MDDVKLVFDFVFYGVLAFMAMDYTLGRALVKDPVRAIVSAVFAVTVAVVLHSTLLS